MHFSVPVMHILLTCKIQCFSQTHVFLFWASDVELTPFFTYSSSASSTESNVFSFWVDWTNWREWLWVVCARWGISWSKRFYEKTDFFSISFFEIFEKVYILTVGKNDVSGQLTIVGYRNKMFLHDFTKNSYVMALRIFLAIQNILLWYWCGHISENLQKMKTQKTSPKKTMFVFLGNGCNFFVHLFSLWKETNSLFLFPSRLQQMFNF